MLRSYVWLSSLQRFVAVPANQRNLRACPARGLEVARDFNVTQERHGSLPSQCVGEIHPMVSGLG